MNIVEIYEYVKKHGNTKVITGNGKDYLLCNNDFLSQCLKANFDLSEDFDILGNDTFDVKEWDEVEYTTRNVYIYGRYFTLDTKYLYAAVDKCGDVYAFVERPSNESIYFYDDERQYLYLGKVKYTGDWEQSVIELS